MSTNGNGTRARASLASPPVPEPASITGRDVRRIAACAAKEPGRYAVTSIELSPLGLAATDGHILCVINLPGWPYQCYIDPAHLKNIENAAILNINGAVEFVHHDTHVRIPHQNPDELIYPRWASLMPDAAFLVPIATLSATNFRRLLQALQRQPDSSVTLYARHDNNRAPLLLANEAGDAGLIMPLTTQDDVTYHFPTALYNALGRNAIARDPVGDANANECPALLGTNGDTT